MNSITAPTSPAPSSPPTSPRRRLMIDAPTRVFHWLLAASFALAYLTGDGEHWRLVHVAMGYTMLGLIGFRLVWGLIGPPQARWSAQARKLRALPDVWRAWLAAKPNWLQSHHVVNTLAIWSVLFLSVVTGGTGYAVYAELGGDWLEELHEVAANATLAVVIGHIGLIVVTSLLRKSNLAATMITGRQKAAGPDVVKRNRVWLGLLIAVAVAGYWVYAWQTAPAADAAAAVSTQKHHDDD